MTRKPKVLLDTSIQIGRFKYKEIEEHIKLLKQTSIVYSSNFVLYEFKTGLILTLIQYWDLVNIYDTPDRAYMKLSESFSSREPKFVLVLDGLISRYLGDRSSDKKTYLDQIESIIFILLSNFHFLIEKNLIGDFASDELVNYVIKSRDDYPGFIKKCAEKGDMIPQRPFWEKNNKELDILLSCNQLESNYPKVHEALKRVRGDFKYANMDKTNKKLGDCVISVDTPKTMSLLATDDSFTYIASALGKNSVIIPNQYP